MAAAATAAAESSAAGPSFARGIVWSLLAAFFAAGFLIPYRFAVEAAGRGTAMSALFISAALFNALVALVRVRPSELRVDRVALTTVLWLTVCTILGNLGVAAALPRIGAGMTSVVLKAQVILTPLLGMWFLAEIASRRLWMGAALALAGFAIPQIVETASEARSSAGYGWALLAAVTFASMQIITRRVILRIQPAPVNAVRLCLAALLLQLVPEGRQVWSLSAEAWGYSALAGALGPGLSRLSLMAALRHISPSVTALVALVGPVLAFGLGFIFFGDAPSPLEVAGAVLILGGVLWALLPSLVRSG